MTNSKFSFEHVSGGVTAPRGFVANGIHSGLKRKRPDLALLLSETPAAAAAVYTTNLVQAAPIHVTREHVAAGYLRAVIVNSGNANACTGEQGLADARQMAAWTGAAVGVAPEEVAVASTGVIGERLPMDKVEAGIARVAEGLGADKGRAAAEAILTTDTFAKDIAIEFELKGRPVRIGGMAKGSGMIHPNMATMLAFITTDAAIATDAWQLLLARSAERTYNRITVDGDTSTNDMIVALANAVAGNEPLRLGEGATTGDPVPMDEGLSGDEQLDMQACLADPDLALFARALDYVNEHLAKAIARDGEGATKLIEVRVTGAATEADAVQVAKSVAGSSLVKTAVYGNDANWGRILAAVGYAGVELDPNRVDICIGDVTVARDGSGTGFDDEAATAALQQAEVVLRVDLKAGAAAAKAWTCDLTEKYIQINASYRS